MPKTRNTEPALIVSQPAPPPLRRKAAAAAKPKAATTTKPTAAAANVTAAAPRKRTSPAKSKAVTGKTVIAEAVIAEAAIAQSTSGLQTTLHPTREEIAELAYLYWEARGYQGGSGEEDWLRAEQELRQRMLSLA